VFIVFMPYFTSSFLDLRQEKENEAKYQKFLLEQRLKAEAKQKIYLTGKFDPAQRKDFVGAREFFKSGLRSIIEQHTETLGRFRSYQRIRRLVGLQ